MEFLQFLQAVCWKLIFLPIQGSKMFFGFIYQFLYTYLYMPPSVRFFGPAEVILCSYLLNYMFPVSFDGFLFTDFRQICGINPLSISQSLGSRSLRNFFLIRLVDEFYLLLP